MASILTPPDTPKPLPPREDGELALWDANGLEGGVTPHLLIQLEDDLERSRMREAAWISVVVHLMVVIFLLMSPKLFPAMGVVLTTPADLLRNQQMTYLDLPPDLQKEPKVAPKTNVLSDKNRIAESRHPSLDQKTLEELKRMGPPKLPSIPAQEAQQAAPQQPPSAPQQQNPQQSQQMAQLQPGIQQDNPRLATPQAGTPNFRAMMSSPGSAVADATRAIAAGRTGGSSGSGGYYGVGPGGSAIKMGPAEVLSDTQGVDFGPYLDRVLQAVRMNWYNIIPEEARPPLLKKGKVSIEFVIKKDGGVAGLRFTVGGQSGDVALDRAAWGGITASNPFAPLPSEFHGPYLALRFHFYYNPGKGDLD
jgi:outer membrane biosynthesis protein TonB